MTHEFKDTKKTPPWLDGIDGEFLPKLIMSDARVILVVAGPGSGKTTGLKRRVQRLIERDGVDPSKIYVGTFTRAIASELQSELGAAIRVSTLHSLAADLLRRNPASLGGLKLRFLLAYEEEAMLYDIATPHLETQAKRKRELRRLQSARAERRDLPDAAFAGEVDRWLRKHGGMLIGDVVHLAVQGLEAEDIPGGAYDHVIVDEYQDLTAAEQELVERIWSSNGSLVVLGDNDQSIYGFRFNHPDGINEFSNRWQEDAVELVEIPENRRCGEAIVELGNLMMAEAGSAKAPMVARSGRRGEVSIVQWPGIEQEIAGLAEHMRAHADRQYLVLVPRRFIGYRLRDAIGDDARTGFYQEVLQHSFAQERFALASVLANPADLVAVRTWLGFHGTQHQQAASRNNEAYSSLARFSGTGEQLLRGMANRSVETAGSGRSNVVARASEMVRLLDGGAPAGLSELIPWLFDPALVGEAEEDDEKKRWLESDLASLRDAALLLSQDPRATLSLIVDRLRYRIATRAPLVQDEHVPRVRIMTLHSAKGLQADNIVIAGVADQLIPGFDEGEDREEERRLLYVAITRAKHELVVSWPRQMTYADAVSNAVRYNGSVRSIGGRKVVQLSRSSLLPGGLGGVMAGSAWLKQIMNI